MNQRSGEENPAVSPSSYFSSGATHNLRRISLHRVTISGLGYSSQSTSHEKTPRVPADATSCGVVLDSQVEDRGLEPVPSSLQKTPLLKQGRAQSNALSGDDERLRVLLVAWAERPESVKTAAGGDGQGAVSSASMLVHRVPCAWPLCNILE